MYAHAFRLGRIERLEQPIRMARFDARSGVAHLNSNRVCTLLCGADGELAAAIIDRAHRLNRVDDEVEDDLPIASWSRLFDAFRSATGRRPLI